MIRLAIATLPGNELRGSNSSKLSTSFVSAVGGDGGAGAGAAAAEVGGDEAEVGGEAGAGAGATAVTPMMGLEHAGGEDDLGADSGGRSLPLQIIKIH